MYYYFFRVYQVIDSTTLPKTNIEKKNVDGFLSGSKYMMNLLSRINGLHHVMGCMYNGQPCLEFAKILMYNLFYRMN